ncbi:molybdenum cofactor guanylyltransferase [Robiginitalea aurantiaca]|uniref:Probable molybdenum cofactor guanylyltransferase n=1 Tax=Robiginitalea aurantiaca TaxID=3056915 RepID=A0ABT7WFQ4_9FLAO|nr:NTP transferase domain-containing protein [Robiginitalea aurantiaca]MDM9631747.1 NTP transferase domain-containing protein [Robiginitalea aurantiaca]
MLQGNEIMGLVLAGGQSRRMGTDKGKLEYHNKPQREYLYEELKTLCSGVFLSIRPEQASEIPEGMDFILDENVFKGPFNGLLSAHHAYPEAAWLVVACDLPLVDKKVLQYLIERRDPGAMATAFATHKSGLPEPLAAIWEPLGLKTAETYMQTSESSCPRKFLINGNTALVFPEDDLWLSNANEPGEYADILSQLNSK